MIEVLLEFETQMRNIGFNLMEDAKTVRDLAMPLLIGLNYEDAEVIADFIDRLFEQNYSSEELVEFWNSMPANLYLKEGRGVTAILTEARDQMRAMLEQRPPVV